MKILYDSKNKTIRKLEPNSFERELNRLENEMLKYLANNRYISLLELKQLTGTDTFEQIHFNLRRLQGRLSIEHKKYVGYRLEDDIWII